MHAVHILSGIILAVLFLTSGLLIRSGCQKVGITTHESDVKIVFIWRFYFPHLWWLVYKKVNLRKTRLWKFRSLTRMWTIAYTSDKICSTISQIFNENLICWTLLNSQAGINLYIAWELWNGNSFLKHCFEDDKMNYAVCGLSWNHCDYWLGRRFICLFHSIKRWVVDTSCWQGVESVGMTDCW